MVKEEREETATIVKTEEREETATTVKIEESEEMATTVKTEEREETAMATVMEEVIEEMSTTTVMTKEKEEEDFEEQDWEEDEELSFSSESEIGEALDYLDSREDAEGGTLDGSFTLLNTRRPNAHGGIHSRPNNSSLQPISNKSQKLTNRIRASPLEVCVDQW